MRSILTLIGDGTPTATFGCVDLGHRIGTLSIANLLRFMTNTLPAPTIATEPLSTALPIPDSGDDHASTSSPETGPDVPINSVSAPSLVLEREVLEAAVDSLRSERSRLEDIVLALRNEASHNVPKAAAMLSALIQSCSSETGMAFLYAAITGMENRFPGTLAAVLDDFLPEVSGMEDGGATIHEL